MASIVLSFVGNQDPVSDQTREEGALITLVRHLQEQGCSIRRVILLCTQTTADRADLTKDWLKDAPLYISGEIIEVIPVEEALSRDPVNLLLAVQAARKGIERAIAYLTEQDKLDFNASSGTPVMKSSWSTLQAAGYAPHSSVWQVRNPQEMQPGQTRVFQTNVDTLKNEFDLKVVQRQIHDYNYSGALATLQETQLSTSLITALLEYGHHRMAFDFNRAFSFIQPFAKSVDAQFIRDIAALRQNSQETLLQEVYFKALIKLKNQQYADFLVLVFGFQENVLRFLIKRKFYPTSVTSSWNQIESEIWSAIRQFDEARLYQYLQNYQLADGRLLRLEQDFISRPMMIAILEYCSELSKFIPPIKELQQYCKQRNDAVHQFAGVSKIENENELINNLRRILKQIMSPPATNPFDTLNEQICSLIEIPL